MMITYHKRRLSPCRKKMLMMMMKAAELGWAGAGQEQRWIKARAGLKHEQGRSRVGTGQEQSRVE